MTNFSSVTNNEEATVAPRKGAYSFGIDLGTTNSCIAVKRPNAPAQVIELADGRSTLPSCVMYKDGKIIVGREAYEHRFDTRHVVYSSKRDIGSDKKYMVYANGDDQPPIEVTPVDVAAEILKKLKADAEKLYGEGFIKDVTVTVPAYFTLERRVATVQAAEKAGLHVLSLINEPTAAAIAYTEGKSTDERILVYDLGGGTFDVTLLEMTKPDAEVASLFDDNTPASQLARVISSAGDSWLGGDDLDTLIFEDALAELGKELIEKKRISKSQNIADLITTESKEKAILTIEQNKKIGSLEGLNIPVHLVDGDNDEVYYLYIGEKGYKYAAWRIVGRTESIVKDCLEGRDIKSIKNLVLVGGSTKSEAIRDFIKTAYPGVRIYMELNPDEAVALGAAVNSAILQGYTDLAVTDVLPQSLGIEITSIVGDQSLDGRYCKLISKNTPLPVSVTTVVTTVEALQEVARIPVFQGEDPIAKNNTPVGAVCLKLSPTQEKQDIKVEMMVDASGILKVTAAAGSEVEQITIQNILNPSANKLTKLEKILNRYELTLQQYAGTEYYTDGKWLITQARQGKCQIAEIQAFFKKLPALDRHVAQVESDSETSFFRFEEDDSENEEVAESDAE